MTRISSGSPSRFSVFHPPATISTGCLASTAGLLQQYTGCSAIGIRLLDDYSNIPYQANIGFSEEFLKRESPLTIKTDSCMCINVIKGTTDPSLPFYTNEGSFYINATTKFLATVSEEEKGKTRNMCNTAGYRICRSHPHQARGHDPRAAPSRRRAGKDGARKDGQDP